ncbi:polysaccharide deacetylase family protein [Subsaxibacter sp. CAU 1640]|uniref:polysaccharide deacetylase family protein n=1 Tax=Subsaxibacter sp. CAU 1640 TaxID=2933271 RepID=UPI0020054EF7|nr:polysaccharide deacetylase family protein [Subsaxibacter sp. CAU 1640]MCK7591721.1 polysaccharide deacetylase family protein [Subsaxibacter sp. CAU 1640]
MARLPILMYHSICQHLNDSKGLTLAVDMFEAQLAYLSKEGYQTFHFSELSQFDGKNKLPKKSVIITFDDVYINQLELAYPLLKKYNFKASFFVPFKYVGGLDSWNTNSEQVMSVEQLRSLDKSIIELGWHSFGHNNYKEMSIDETKVDLEACQSYLKQHQLSVKPVLAYPFGKYPRTNPKQDEFFKSLEDHQITYGLRIGNRVNSFPFKNKYEVQRIDIKGEDSLAKFKLKLRFGKLKLF